MTSSSSRVPLLLLALAAALALALVPSRAAEGFAPPKLTAKPGMEYTAADSVEFMRNSQIPEWNAKWVMWDAKHRQRAL
jgi:hypothetical protein